MKKIILPIVAAVSSMALHVHAQVGVNTDKPTSTFDITAKNATGTTKNVDGLLIPRVDRERAQNMSSVPTSTLIYINSAATGSQTGTAINIDAAGYYYYNGTAWTKLTSTGSNNIYNTDGTLTGNRIVTQGTNTIAFNGSAVNAFSVDGTTLSVDAANNRVGIGTTTPNAPLQLVNGLGNRKIILHEGANNDNEFYGFGINDYTLRYQSGANHVFYAGTGPTSSTELFRVNGDGNVAVGTSTPQKKFHVNGTAQFTNEINVGGTATTVGSPGTAGQVLTSAGVGAAPTWTTPAVATSTNIYNADGTLTGNRTVAQGANTIAFNGTAVNAFSVDGGTLSVDAANDRVGIGKTAPQFLLDLGNQEGKKISLYNDSGSNFWGFGLGNNALDLYTANNKLMTLGTTNVGIGTSTPQKKLHVDGDLQITKELNVGGSGNVAGSAGTAGQILTSAGAGAAPTWTTPAAVTSTNIYNADGTLTGNRTVTQGANTLAFNGTAVNAFSVDGTTLSVDAANNRVGIGTNTPTAQLQLSNTTANRKIALFDNLDNDNQFYGFGVNSFLLRYQTGGAAADHGFFSGIDKDSSKELMRIKGDGNVGIGTSTPQKMFHVTGASQFGNEINVGGTATTIGSPGTAGQILTSAGAGAAPTWTTPAVVTSTNIYNADGTLTGNRIVTQGANTLAFNGTAVNAFSVDGTTLSVDAANNRVGIGTDKPNAPLQLANGLGNRKIVLHEGANNDNEFYGFGINDYTLRYQSGANHVFYAGTGPTSSTELFRVNGDGNVAVGTSTPQKKFHVNGTAQFTNEINVGGTATTVGSPGTAGQVLTSAGVGAAPTWTTPAVATSTNIYNTDGTLNGNRTVTQGANTLAFAGTGNVGVGVTNPVQKLSVVGGNDATPYSGIASFLPSNTTQGVGIGWSGIQKIGSMANADLTVDAKGTGNIALQTQATGNVGIGTTAPAAKLHVNGTAQFNNEIKVGASGNAGTTGQVLISNGAGAAPKWGTIADVTPTSTGSVLVVDGKFIIAQEISVQMTGDFTSTGSGPAAIGNLTNEIIDNENRFNGTASGNSFTVGANGTYQLTMNASLTDVGTDLNPVIGIFDDTTNQWIARVNDQYKSTGSPGVPKLQTYTLIVAFPLVTTHTYSFRQATPTGTITVKSHSTAYTTPDNISAPFTQMSLKRLK
ncbi:beta strand repeat-containing protein [Chryseobacterium sp. OV279]|uniref:beta strand repeat-containing protein n=1 Tax=Chryseobacterium sp. OV279 TaxID=1500285 RepID=UPI00091D2233|nr:hypothetical protein [Chryseobacterium sp. OV279]SHG23808.1 hypothetical protein SAMN02787100_3542 [Chryseobacterium sp. OV279]